MQAQEAMKSVDKVQMRRLLAVLSKNYPQRADSLSLQSQLHHALGELGAAKKLAREALQIDPSAQVPFSWLLEQLQRDGEFPEALALCNTVLSADPDISTSRLVDIHMNRGEIAMIVGDYDTARASYEFALQKAHQGERIPRLLLVHAFNHTEAVRRCTGDPQTNAWKQVIALFQASGESSDNPMTIQANNWQAIHIAYAMTGDLDRARAALVKAGHAANQIGEAEDIFTPKTYRNVPMKEFLKINEEMLDALDHGQLWDGMPLPKAKPPRKTRWSPKPATP
jgi:tetratricopeptide (TPR) repeat protein